VLPDLSNPAVIFGTIFSLARGACCICSYTLLKYHFIDASLAEKIGGGGMTLATLAWIVYANHFQQKKLQDAKDSSTIIVNPLPIGK